MVLTAPEKEGHTEATDATLAKAVSATIRERDNLTTLRIRDLLTDDEFTKRREELDRQVLQLVQQPSETQEYRRLVRIVANDDFIQQQSRRMVWHGSDQLKHSIVMAAGSNPVLTSGMLSIVARKPLRQWSDSDDIPEMWALLKDVRTLYSHRRSRISRIGMEKIKGIVELAELTVTSDDEAA